APNGELVQAATMTSGACQHPLAFEQELLMADTWIVDDARAEGLGPWSFGGLMTRIAGKHPAAKLVRDWLGAWESDATFTPPGGKPETVPGNQRNVHDLLLAPWPKAADGSLNLAKAPFRLLAITYR